MGKPPLLPSPCSGCFINPSNFPIFECLTRNKYINSIHSFNKYFSTIYAAPDLFRSSSYCSFRYLWPCHIFQMLNAKKAMDSNVIACFSCLCSSKLFTICLPGNIGFLMLFFHWYCSRINAPLDLYTALCYL